MFGAWFYAHHAVRLRKSANFARFSSAWLANAGEELKEIACDATVWQQVDEVPAQVRDTLHALRLPSIQVSEWTQLSELQRFALIKLTRTDHTRNLEPALREFGLLPR